jgi:hypothetical protein
LRTSIRGGFDGESDPIVRPTVSMRHCPGEEPPRRVRAGRIAYCARPTARSFTASAYAAVRALPSVLKPKPVHKPGDAPHQKVGRFHLRDCVFSLGH